MNVEAVHDAVERAAERARAGEGPTLLEFRTYRYKGHSMSDPQKYRSKEEVEEYKQRDPIEQVRQTILDKKIATEKDLAAIEAKVNAQVEESVKFAEESNFPDPSEALKTFMRAQLSIYYGLISLLFNKFEFLVLRPVLKTTERDFYL
jgi:pyruvate dehydrogenase E1 component alpha subunit